MFKKLQRKNFEKRIDRALKNRDRSGLNGAVKTMGILYNGETISDQKFFNALVSTINISEENKRLLGLVTFDKKETSLPKHLCTKKNFSWFGDIKGATTSGFVKEPVDVLVGYYNAPDPYLDMLVAKSKAQFKIGFAGADERLFDLILSVKPEEADQCNAEILKYLKILGKL